jgi:DnaD/phage-associated family protein
MTPVKGLGDGRFVSLALPGEFFDQILASASSLDELKVILCAAPLMNPQKDAPRWFFLDDLQESDAARLSFAKGEGSLQAGLEKACGNGLLLAGEYQGRTIYFLNTPRSNAALRAMQKGAWSPDLRQPLPAKEIDQKPNIYALYEKNIGPLTPILAETLEDAEKEYPAEWLEEAVKIAVKKNVRNWQYIEAILRSWKEKGRGEKDQRNNKEDARKYIEGDLADYIKH